MNHELFYSLIKQLDGEAPRLDGADGPTEGAGLMYRADNRLDAVEQLKARFDQTAAILNGVWLDGHRLDAGESAVLARELLYVQQRQVTQLYTEMKSTRFIPIDSSMPAGVQVFTTEVFAETGSVKLISNYATDFPLADVSKSEVLGKCLSFGNAYHWSVEDLRRSAMARGVPLPDRRAAAARLVHAKFIDNLMALGDANTGLTGIASHSGVTILTAGSEITGDWANPATTEDEVFADLALIENTVYIDSGELIEPDTMVLPNADGGGAYAALFDRKSNDFSNESIGSVWLKTRAKYVKSIDQWNKLNEAGATGATRAICYKRSSDILDGKIPLAFMQHPDQQKMLAFITPCESKCGGTVLYRPFGMVYADGV